MKRQRALGILLGALLLSWAGSARAAKPETFEPGTGKYIVVLKDPRTDVDDPATGRKKAKEPDLVKHGGTLLHKKDATRIIKLPTRMARELRKEENVAYVQRVWLGESREKWSEDDLTSLMTAGPEPALEALETDLTWETGQYLYDGSGNIKQIGNDTYRYDTMGRLKQAVVKGITETYQYDSFGNLIEKSISGLPGTIEVDSSSNRLRAETYDVAGNLTTRSGVPRYNYDSFSMIDKISKPGTPLKQRILYGPDDERIGVIIEDGVLSRWKIRDFSGKVLTEFKADDFFGVWEWTEDYVYGDGRLLAAERESFFGGKRHFHTDHLGTVRMITNQSRQRISVHDFYPFGVEQTDATQEYNKLAGPHLSGDFRSEPMKFTSHERDWHGWLNVDNDDYVDYMHARYYDPNLGRFLSVDPGRDWDMRRPQSWNLYSYVGNNPMTFSDPNGRERVYGADASADTVIAELRKYPGVREVFAFYETKGSPDLEFRIEPLGEMADGDQKGGFRPDKGTMNIEYHPDATVGVDESIRDVKSASFGLGIIRLDKDDSTKDRVHHGIHEGPRKTGRDQLHAVVER